MITLYIIYCLLNNAEIATEATKMTIEATKKQLGTAFIPYVDDRYMAKTFKPNR